MMATLDNARLSHEQNLLRADFPILNQHIHHQPLIYLDSAATTQKPRCVIDALTHYYTYDNANIHRGVHTLSDRATTAYELARQSVKNFIGAQDAREIIFVRGATEAINLVAQSFVQPRLHPGDEIIISLLEHHANWVPWQRLCQQTGAVLRIISLDEGGDLDLAHYQRLLSPKTKMLAISHVSNALGTVNPVRDMIRLAREQHIPVLIDGAQAVQHFPIDVQALDCDFYVFSGHKCYGPTGIGVLYGKLALLEAMPPYQTGGGMISSVAIANTEYAPVPYKFEAGTPSIADAIGLAAALQYLKDQGREAIADHEQDLLRYAIAQLSLIDSLRIIGRPRRQAGVISFTMDAIHPHDIGTVLDHEGIAIRVGHHCAMPLMTHWGLAATARVSLGLYNTREDIDSLCAALHKTKRLLG